MLLTMHMPYNTVEPQAITLELRSKASCVGADP